MSYSIRKSKVIFHKEGTYLALTREQMAHMYHELGKAMDEHQKLHPRFKDDRHWNDNGDGSFTTTNRK